MASACSPDRFRKALERIADAVLLADGTGTVRFAKRQSPELVGYAIEELLGRELERLVPAGRFRQSRFARTGVRAAGGNRPHNLGIGDNA